MSLRSATLEGLAQATLVGWIACAHALEPIPAVTATRLAALDCSRISAADVAEVLARTPAPRVIALHGSVPIVTMEPFAAFLEAMGYPRERLVNPADGSRTYSSHVDPRRLAGHIAWHYEREGLMPVLIGHSLGGMVVVRVLHELAGARGVGGIAVWAPTAPAPEPRTSIVDPLTRATRDVGDLKVGFAAALATGSPIRRLLGAWGLMRLLLDVPDSVEAFAGFGIPWDPIAGTGAQPAPFHATGSADVRNVVLPASYSHVDLPRTDHLAAQGATRSWIESYRPGSDVPPPIAPDVANLVHAAELWYAVKRHWCEGAKRLAARPTGN